MAQKHTAVEVQDPTGNQLRAVSQENDFPLPPVDELRKLHEFRPDLVDKIIGLIAKEAEERRARSAKIDTSITKIFYLPLAQSLYLYSPFQVLYSLRTQIMIFQPLPW